jgi:hypothetical protein
VHLERQGHSSPLQSDWPSTTDCSGALAPIFARKSLRNYTAVLEILARDCTFTDLKVWLSVGSVAVKTRPAASSYRKASVIPRQLFSARNLGHNKFVRVALMEDLPQQAGISQIVFHQKKL